MDTPASPLVSTGWLDARLGAQELRIVDGSWYMPASGRDPVAEFEAGHIPGAVYFDVDAIADRTVDLPHMMADPAVFGVMAGALGLSPDKTIVVYDGAGLFSAARVWWNLKAMGATDVRVLDGGFPKWQAEGRAIEGGAANPAPAKFEAKLQPGAVVSASDILAFLESSERPQIVDMRSTGRFAGTAPEPRAGVRGGHIPTSVNLPFAEMIEDGRLKEPARLRQLIEAAGIDPHRELVSSCGSGVTAPILNLALAVLGIEAMAIYDGSWTEWGGNPDLPIA